jgi:hypothetical protein
VAAAAAAAAVFFLLLAVAVAVELPAPTGGFWLAVAAACRSLPILFRGATPRARKRGQERPDRSGKAAEEPAGRRRGVGGLAVARA